MKEIKIDGKTIDTDTQRIYLVMDDRFADTINLITGDELFEFLKNSSDPDYNYDNNLTEFLQSSSVYELDYYPEHDLLAGFCCSPPGGVKNIQIMIIDCAHGINGILEPDDVKHYFGMTMENAIAEHVENLR